MENVIGSIVMKRIDRGEPQSIHIPWPAEFGEYGKSGITDAEMDRWVESHISVPEPMAVIGVCPGRAYKGKALIPCLVVTVGPRKHSNVTPIRRTWADGDGSVR